MNELENINNNCIIKIKNYKIIDSSISNESVVDECSICLDDITDRTPIRTLKCGHVFHKGCIEQWFKKYITCPYCRNCELDIDCFWLWLQPYNLSFFNRFFKYKLIINKNSICLQRKKNIYIFSYKRIKRVRANNKKLQLLLGNNSIITILCKDTYATYETIKNIVITNVANANVNWNANANYLDLN